MKIPRNFFENLFIVCSLILYSGGFTYFIAVTNPLYGLVSLLSQAVSVVTLLLLIKRWKIALSKLLQERTIIITALLSVASLVWSAPAMSEVWYRAGSGGFMGSGVFPLLRVTLFGVYLSSRYNLRQQYRLLCWALGVCALFSLLVAVAMPTYGVMGSLGTQEDIIHAGAWRGIYVHKNILGNVMALSSTSFLVLLTSKQFSRTLCLIFLGVSVFLVFMSSSATSLVLVVSLAAVNIFCRIFRMQVQKLIAFTSAGIVLMSYTLVMLYENFGAVAGILGRDPNLTGRVGLWMALSDNIKEHFWFGYGYNAFWLSVNQRLADVWSPAGRLSPTHSHNGFLDLWLDLGLIGLIVFLLGFGLSYLRAALLIRRSGSWTAIFSFLFLTYLFQVNQTESALVREGLLWLLYVSTSLSLCSEVRILSKLPRYAGSEALNANLT
jgi:Lipid A core - O-antigen ligase and related enzymes